MSKNKFIEKRCCQCKLAGKKVCSYCDECLKSLVGKEIGTAVEKAVKEVKPVLQYSEPYNLHKFKCPDCKQIYLALTATQCVCQNCKINLDEVQQDSKIIFVS